MNREEIDLWCEYDISTNLFLVIIESGGAELWWHIELYDEVDHALFSAITRGLQPTSMSRRRRQNAQQQQQQNPI